MALYPVRCGAAVIGHVALSDAELRQRKLTARLDPGPEFGRYPALLEQLFAARLQAARAGATLAERQRNEALVEETLGFWLLSSSGMRLGRVVGLIDHSTPQHGEQWDVEVLMDEPSYPTRAGGSGTA